jgi:hypothetical protein
VEQPRDELAVCGADRTQKRPEHPGCYVKAVIFHLSTVAILRHYSIKPNARATRRHTKGMKMERVGKVVDFLVLSVSILMVVMGLASLLRF